MGTEDTGGTTGDGDPGTSGTDDNVPVLTSQLRVDEGVEPTTTGLDSTSSSGDSGSTGEAESSTGIPQEESSTGVGTLTVADLELGDLVVTEIMGNPACNLDNCEWIEIYNAAAQPIQLFGLHVYDAEFPQTPNFGVVQLEVVLPAGEYAVLAKSRRGWNFEFDPDARYGPQLGLNNNRAEQVILADARDNVLAETPLFFFFSDYSNVSVAFTGDPGVDDATDSALWCPSGEDLPVTAGPAAFGSPHAANTVCGGPVR